jgi:hypothetical protein
MQVSRVEVNYTLSVIVVVVVISIDHTQTYLNVKLLIILSKADTSIVKFLKL